MSQGRHLTEDDSSLGEFIDPTTGSGRYYLNPDIAMIRRIVSRLTQITRTAEIDLDQLGSSGRNIHMPGWIAQSNEFTRQITEVTGRREITVLVDCSGSMKKTWRYHGGLEFVVALKRLHCRNVLKVNCWLSGGNKCYKLPLRRIPEQLIGLIRPQFNNESFGQCVRNAMPDMKRSSLTVGWTDGMISDGDVDYRLLQRRGIDIIGCAPRNPVKTESQIQRNMIKHFGKGYVGDAEALARHIAHYALRKSNS